MSLLGHALLGKIELDWSQVNYVQGDGISALSFIIEQYKIMFQKDLGTTK